MNAEIHSGDVHATLLRDTIMNKNLLLMDNNACPITDVSLYFSFTSFQAMKTFNGAFIIFWIGGYVSV